MRTKSLVTIVFALLLLGGGGGALAQQQQEGVDPSLWVEVRDEQGMPLKNACITLVPAEGDILFRKSDGKGRVRIKKLTRGRYRVTAKIDGYEAQKKEVLMSGTSETVSFSLEPRH
ncbi:MAG TPA: carboxypeptidase-like regulatory domain-containing protein [Pyrinomonadaceae bacterium]|jgi:hypothetical protein|nr:carboxypeptidase-like regulatory domain-containing protein [Pyrinomonadaceae bacterium]